MRNDASKNTDFKYSVTITDYVSAKAPVLLGGKISACIKKAKRYGYDAVELHYSDPEKINLPAALDAFGSEGMSVSGIATGSTYVVHKLSLTDAYEKIREAAIKRLYQYIDVAEKLSSTLIVGCVRGNIGANDDRNTIIGRLSESMQMVCIYAQSRNVPVVLEAINRYENNYINTALETVEFIKASRIQNLRILLDTFHMNIEEADMADAIMTAGNLLGYVHVADSNRMYPGRGHTNFKSIVGALSDINYNGYLSAECMPHPDGDRAAAAWREFFIKNMAGES
jgi:sugar phosphate isomerase/epimerase